MNPIKLTAKQVTWPAPLDPFVKMALSMCLGEECQGCHETFDTLESLLDSVWWPWKKGRYGHKACYEKANTRTLTT